MASSTTGHEEAVTLVDTGVLHIKQLRGPDVLPDSNRKLRTYLKDSEEVGQRSLQPVTGDQVVFRVKEAPKSTSDVAAARDVSKSSQQHAHQFSTTSSSGATAAGPTVSSSSSSTPKASGPQVAVLGSPQVPVGLSSALGYLHLGQVARVKVPPHLLGQAVTDDMGAIHDVEDNPTSPVTRSSPRKQEPGQEQEQQQHVKDIPSGSPMPLAAADAANSRTTPAKATAGAFVDAAGHPSSSASSTSPQQQQQVLSSHPINVVEAATHGAVPVHVSSSSSNASGGPSDGHHRSPGEHMHMHMHHGDRVVERPATPSPEAITTGVAAGSDSQHGVRQFSDPVIIRPKGWIEKQQQQAALNGAGTTAAISSLSPTAAGSGGGGGAPHRSGRVAAAAAHAAAATAGDPIRRAVAAAMGKTSAAPLGATVSTGAAAAATAAAAAVSDRHPSPYRGVAAGGALTTPLGTEVSTSTAASDVPRTISSDVAPRLTDTASGPELRAPGGPPPPPAAAARPSPSPAVLPDSPDHSSQELGVAAIAAAAPTLAISSSHSRGSPSVSKAVPGTTAGSSNSVGGRAISPAAFRRSPSPITGRSLGGFTRADRGTTPDKSQAGPSGIAFFSRISPQASSEAPVPAAPHPSPANDSTGGPGAQQPGGVKAVVSKLQQQLQQKQQEGVQKGGSEGSGWSEPTPPTAQSSTAAAGGVAARAAATSLMAAEAKTDWAGSNDSGDHAGFVTPPAADGTPFFTPGSNTPQGTTSSDAGSTISSNSNSGSIQALGLAPSKTPIAAPRSLKTLWSSAGGGVGSASSSSSAGGAVRSPRSSGWQQQQDGAAASAAGGAVTVVGGGPTARQLAFGRSAAAARPTGPGVPHVPGQPVGGSALLQAAAEKLRREYDGAPTNVVTAQTAAATGTGVGRGAAQAGGATRVGQKQALLAVMPQQQARMPSSSISTHAVSAQVPDAVHAALPPTSNSLSKTQASGRSSAGAGAKPGAAAAGLPESKSSGDQVPVSFGNWLPSEGATRDMDLMAAAAAMAAAEAKRGTGAGSSGTGTVADAVVSSRRSAAAGAVAVGDSAAAAPAGFGGPGVGGYYNSVSTSSGRTVTMDESSSDVHMRLDMQQYPAAHHRVEGFSPSVSSGSGQVVVSGSAAAAMHAEATEGYAHADNPLPGGALPSTASGPVSPSKAVAAAALAEFAAASAARPAAAAASSASPRASSEMATAQSQARVKPSQTPFAASSVAFSRPIEHALIPTAVSAAARPHLQEPEAHGRRSVSGTVQQAGSPIRSSSTAAPEVGPGTGSTPTAGAHSGAAAGSVAGGEGGDAQRQATDGSGDRVEYEVEVLAIIPGHGPLSGQPVLSEAAQQEHINPSDIRAAAAAATSDAPQLVPPKPRKGFSGWVRRHLSLNTSAPWRAGKSGLGMIGLRGCFGAGKGKNKGAEGQGDQPEHRPQGQQQYQSWME